MSKPTFKEAFLFWLKLGFISFGGPAGQVAIMHDYLVDKKKWISNQKFLHAYNYCMLLPGPEAQQLATYIGWLLHGTLGGLTAGLLFILPSVFILLGLSIAYVTVGNIPAVQAIFTGLKPAVLVIIMVAFIKIGKKSLLSNFHYAIALLAFIAIFFFNIAFPIIIVATALLGFIIIKYLPNYTNNKKTDDKETEQASEAAYYLNTETILPNIGFNSQRLLQQSAVALILWVSPFILFLLASNSFLFWKNLSVFFTQAALVTFGGAYAVLPYVAQVSVAKMQWLSYSEMIDGLALGETTPGPLIMVLAFVGFMAGYNAFSSSILSGTIGLLVTVYYTFLPCFFFIFAGAPIIEKTQENKFIKQLLSFITAAVLGVIINLAIYFGKTVLFENALVSFQHFQYLSALWCVVSFVALQYFNVNMILWIVVSGIAGLLQFVFTT